MPRKKSDELISLLAAFGARLRCVRLDRGLTRARLGEMVGVSGYQIGFYETGRCQPDILTLVRVARMLNVSLKWLLTGEARSTS